MLYTLYFLGWGFPHVVLVFLLSIHITETVKARKKYINRVAAETGEVALFSVQAFRDFCSLGTPADSFSL